MMSRAFHLLALALLGLLAVGSSVAVAQSDLKAHDTEQPLDVRAENLEADNKAGRARFTGNVTVVQGGITLESDELLVFYSNPFGNADPKISRLDATGKVHLLSSS